MTTQTLTNWVIDPSHSDVAFKVKHLMISTVNGHFGSFRAEVGSNEDFSQANLLFTVDAASINTGNEQRDGHLKSDDFFNTDKYPSITFKLDKIERKEGAEFVYHGNLTIRDNTLPISLLVTYNGMMTDPYGQVKAGFEVEGKISRKAFGLMWDATTETGGIVVSDEVKIHCNIQVIRQA